MAGEYYDNDFEWESVVEEGQAALALQRHQYYCKNNGDNDNSNGSRSTPPTEPHPEVEFYKQDGWEKFHQHHSTARFFKEKRYIPLAFPVLQQSSDDRPLHVAEIGCGCGSALLPVLKANPNVRATACDVSDTAVALCRQAAQQAGIEAHRLHLFSYDASSSSTLQPPLLNLNADCMLMIFTLSALWPADMPAMLQHAYDALRPGGLLLFRDYGMYDIAQCRFSGDQVVDVDAMVYVRQDGTLASFFTIERIEALAKDVGFTETVECVYARTKLKNNKNGKEMKRVFVNAVFRK